MISVVIPVYNKAETIGLCLNSVYAQTYLNYEIILVDDGSKDDLDSKLKPYENMEKLKIIHQTNSGVSAARNTGIDNSKGEYICFLDADDEWLPNHLEVISGLIEKYSEAGAYFTSVRIISPGGKESETGSLLKFEGTTSLIDDYFKFYDEIGAAGVLYSISVCVPKAVFQKSGKFQPGVRIGEDYDLWFRIAAYYSIALSKIVTNIYHRELSTATQATDMDIDWYFQKREKTLMDDISIPLSKRTNLRIAMDRFRIRKCRHLLLAGRRQEAKEVIAQITSASVKRELFKTKLCFMIPSFILNKLYHMRKLR